MKTLSISKFKAQALQLIQDVAESREGLVVTKRGKPVVQVIPYSGPPGKPRPGKLSSALVFETDIVSPLDPNLWEAAR